MRISWIAARCYTLLTGRGRWVQSCRALAGQAGAPGARRLLDVGSGPGTVALEMEAVAPGARVVGLDASRRMLAEARRRRTRGRVLWVCGDATRLPFRAGVFDGAAGHSVLYLTADPQGVLREVMRVLRPGGRAGFVEPRVEVRKAAWRAGRAGLRFTISMLGWRWVSRSHRRYDEQEMVDLLKGCDYREVRGEAAVEGFGVCVTGRKC